MDCPAAAELRQARVSDVVALRIWRTRACYGPHDRHMTTPLAVENVIKRFRQGERRVAALNGVTLDVKQGQFLAIMGASGSGKSTLLHLMAALAAPDEGRVIVNGQDLGQLNDRELTLFRRRNIGLIFQSFNLIPTLTAEENVALPLMLEGRNGSAGQAKVNELLASLGLASRRG